MVQKGSLVEFLWGFLMIITAPKWDFLVSLLSVKVLDQISLIQVVVCTCVLCVRVMCVCLRKYAHILN